VSFEVPDLYAGRAEYAAVRADKKWKITEFKLPAYKIHIIVNDRGIWELQEATEE
jgi:hypothetical protein